MIIELSDENTTLETLINSNTEGKVVLYFTASWCGPCKAIYPKVFEISNNMGDDIVFYKIDVDTFADLSEECGVSCMPTFQFYKNGKKVDELQGADANQLSLKCSI